MDHYTDANKQIKEFPFFSKGKQYNHWLNTERQVNIYQANY